MIKKSIRAFKLLYLAFFKKTNKLKNEKLEAQLRTRVHAVEKRGNIEGNSYALSMILGRKYFFEAKKRNILSQEEIDWCELVLFAKELKKQIKIKTEENNGKLINTIIARRSIRSWKGGELNKDDFELLINSAKWAPSSCHRQPWHFLLTNERDKIKLLSEIRGQKFVKGAPSCILVLINIDAYKEEEVNYTPYLDAGAAIQNLLLTAESLGFGACWVNFGKMEVDDKNMAKAKAAFAIPKEFKIVSIIPIGKNSGAKPHAPGRKSTKNIIHIEKY